ncbi:MAG: AI-2E family transporter [Candidatus Zambryskibacteria bacterium]|nr:AI-2E family transporter [Candidatus Zambryskibacteria bacterium]
MINRSKVEIIFFSVLFGAVLVLTFFVFKPFFTTLFLAATFAIVLFPLYQYILKLFKGREIVSVLTTIFIGLVFVILPVVFLGQEAFEQARSLYVKFSTNNISEFDYVARLIEEPIQKFVPDFSIDVDQYIRLSLGWVTDNFKDVLFGTLTVVVDVFLIILALFFFLKDGKRFVQRLTELSPLHDAYDRELLEKTANTITTVVKGTLLIALVQGVLAGIGLAIFGVPNAVLWGALAALCAFVPGLGTAIVIIPSVIYLFVIGNIPFAIGLSAWGMILVGMIDNVLGPYLYKRGTRLHSLVVLFAVLGGISFFGPEGVLLGPVIASLFISLIHIYEKMVIAK